MSDRNWRERIEDILVCARNILDFTSELTYEAFLYDIKTVRAVAFELTTIGEAVRAIPNEIQSRYPDVPWQKMLGIRNVMVHEYFRIDEEILWMTVKDDIPKLIVLLEAILADQ